MWVFCRVAQDEDDEGVVFPAWAVPELCLSCGHGSTPKSSKSSLDYDFVWLCIDT